MVVTISILGISLASAKAETVIIDGTLSYWYEGSSRHSKYKLIQEDYPRINNEGYLLPPKRTLIDEDGNEVPYSLEKHLERIEIIMEERRSYNFEIVCDLDVARHKMFVEDPQAYAGMLRNKQHPCMESPGHISAHRIKSAKHIKFVLDFIDEKEIHVGGLNRSHTTFFDDLAIVSLGDLRAGVNFSIKNEEGFLKDRQVNLKIRE